MLGFFRKFKKDAVGTNEEKSALVSIPWLSSDTIAVYRIQEDVIVGEEFDLSKKDCVVIGSEDDLEVHRFNKEEITIQKTFLQKSGSLQQLFDVSRKDMEENEIKRPTESEVRTLCDAVNVSYYENATDRTKRKVSASWYVAVVEKGMSFQVLEALGFCCANYDIDTEEHMTFLNYWDAMYGLQLVGCYGSSILLRVQHTPSSIDEAIELAYEQAVYCPDSESHIGLANMAAHNLRARGWEFWWD